MLKIFTYSAAVRIVLPFSKALGLVSAKTESAEPSPFDALLLEHIFTKYMYVEQIYNKWYLMTSICIYTYTLLNH